MGVPEEKTLGNKDENQQQIQPTYDEECGNQYPTRLVGGERSHHCAIPVQISLQLLLLLVDMSGVYKLILRFHLKVKGLLAKGFGR